MKKAQIECLMKTADNIRLSVLRGTYLAGSGHPGGSLSIADLLAYLYFKEMKIDPANPRDPERDRLVLSKGHAAPALYGVLAERGYFAKEEIDTLRKIGSRLQGHPDMKNTPGVDMTTGSLGQGISAACGMALGAKKTNQTYRVFAILGDGELNEGQVWEAAMFASHFKLDNLCAFIDVNGLQIDGTTAEVMNTAPIDQKFKAFGWNTLCIDGHNFEEIENALDSFANCKDKPTAIVMNTIKGKGVSFMEGKVNWHGASPKEADYQTAVLEITQRLEGNCHE
ncbi:MAG: transketolase [Clostridiales bacterium]|nr:transketolase [Clostridiales bacterium]